MGKINYATFAIIVILTNMKYVYRETSLIAVNPS